MCRRIYHTIEYNIINNIIVSVRILSLSNKEEYIFELWSTSESKRLKTINLTSIDKHGKVHSDALFGSLRWSGCETKIVYVAEKKKPKTSSFFEKTSNNSDSNTNVKGEK